MYTNTNKLLLFCHDQEELALQGGQNKNLARLPQNVTAVVRQSALNFFFPPSRCLFLHNCLLVPLIISPSGIQLHAVINIGPPSRDSLSKSLHLDEM